jgi:hypothetical protein
MSGVKQTVSSGRSIAVDFVQRRRVDDPAGPHGLDYEDPDALEATSLLDRVTGGAVAPPSSPAEADEFFDELHPDPAQEQPEDVEELDPWIARQAQPGQTTPTVSEGPANGTAGLSGDVPLVRRAARRERAPRQPRSLPRPHVPALRHPHLPALPRVRLRAPARLRGRALRLGTATLAGVAVLAGLGALFGSSTPSHSRTGAASFNATAAVGPPFPGLAKTITAVDTAVTHATSVITTTRSGVRAHKLRVHARSRRKPHRSHPAAVTHQSSGSSSPPLSSSQPTVNYTPVTSGSSASAASDSGQAAGSGSPPTQSTSPAGPSGNSAMLGPGHCGC